MEKLSTKHRLIIGFTLFSMFFGAGNLIFPPFLGNQAGNMTMAGMVGFILTAVCFPILGVIALAKHEGLENMLGIIHPKFAVLFSLLVYLLIGPCVAIPRTSSTSFEMAVAPFVQMDQNGLMTARIIYSLVFFGLSALMATRPDHLKDLLGKIMTPVLLVLIALMFFGAIIKLPILPGAASGNYAENPVMRGFTDGYQTMDTLAALQFGIVIAMNIRSFGVSDKHAVSKETMKAGCIAGIMLIVIYGAMSILGLISSGENGIEAINGTQVLSYVVANVFGGFGQIIVGIIFFIACFNVCTGLLCCCSTYFSSVFPKLSYNKWLILFAVFSFIESSAGLDFILNMSLPILQVMCPIAILLIIFGLVVKRKEH